MKNEQTTIKFSMDEAKKGPVTCLGKTFNNDQERRDYFVDLLKEKLKDPEFRKIEGFPIGNDEDILALSDPPYYTACPNPWINDFIKEWEMQKGDRANKPYQREPFAADVSEGKNDPIYNAHSYHTKVPYKAIMRYILHYTEPGDIIFDGFCGTGMTGVAAQMCGDRKAVQSLGFQIKKDGSIIDEQGNVTSELGTRKAILNDLSPAATFISYNYNSPLDIAEFEKEAKRILADVEEEFGWMFETLHSDGRSIGKINYTVWSDVFICPNCSKEVVFWDAAVDMNAGKVELEFPCPFCLTNLSKRKMDRAFITKYYKHITDSVVDHEGFEIVDQDGNRFISKGRTIKQAKQVPVMIKYSIGKKNYQKKPDERDLALIDKIEQIDIPYWFPLNELPDGFNTEQPKVSHGLTHIHHFYTKRNLFVLSALKYRSNHQMLNIIHQSINTTLCSRLVRYNMGNRGNGILTGTLYISSMNAETNPLLVYKSKLNGLKKGINRPNYGIISTASTTNMNDFGHNTVDYIFTDPPFGGNLMYSELNFIWESWLKTHTNIGKEAIENKVQNKGLFEYQTIMTECFKDCFRVLKPGHWMTVEFHNSKNSVWNSIQESLQVAGFVIADVRTLDKQSGSFKQVTSAFAVKQDLIISCYKPNGGLEDRFKHEAESEEGVWDFVRTHLNQLPRIVIEHNKIQTITERQNYLLYDRMVAFYVQRSVMVPLSSGEFYRGLEERFPVRDGMYFLPEQVVEYDKKRMSIPEIAQMQIFVTDEVSARQWLKQLLANNPQSFQEIHPQFMKEISGWSKTEKALELSLLLEQNFLKYDGKGDVPSQIHSYLSTNWKDLRNKLKDDPLLKVKAKDRWFVPDYNKAADMEQMREKALLKEFLTYLPESYKLKKKDDQQLVIGDFPSANVNIPKGKRFKVIRLEAVRAGFKHCWQNRDYETIIAVAERIPTIVLEEDPKLLMYYDQAITRTQ
jgi:DNA modification methylase